MGGGIVNPLLVQTGIFCGWIQQLHAVVVSRLRVDDQEGTNGKRRVHRSRHVENPFVSVGVLHGQGIDPWTAIRVGATVHVFLNVSRHDRHRQFARQTVQLVGHFIPPREVEPRTISQGACLRVGGDDHLVRQSLNMAVGDFTCTIVGCTGIRGPQDKRKDNPCDAKPCPTDKEWKDVLHHEKTKVLVATFDLTP